MHNKKYNNSKSQNFIQGLRPLSSLIPRGIKKIIRKGGYNFTSIVDNWTKMVGKEISGFCYPIKIKSSRELSNGILTINVLHGKELEVEYKKNEIKEKINSFFGYNCIGEIRLKIVQEKKMIIKEIKHKSKPVKRIEQNINQLKNSNLKNSLNQLLKAFSEKND
ncbi:MAG: DciA family protein [Pelagibacteraceae bacterium]